MITIHIGPPENDPRDDDRNVDQAQNPKTGLARTFLGIVLILAVIMIISLMTACSGTGATAAYQYQVPAKLEDGWETDSLANVGLDSKQITAMMVEIQNGGYENLYSLLILKDGKLGFEEYFRGHNRSSIDDVASVTKSVTSILIGIAIDQAFMDSSDQYLADLLPSYAKVINADPQKQKLQLWHLLTMTSGIEWDEETYPYGDNRNDATAMERSADPVQFILDRPIIREPGTHFQYSGANSMLLSAILQEATGMTLADFAKQNLFAPLGISQYRWDKYADGHTNTDGGLSLRPRDMAKIGQLMLNNGQWNGVQIISPEWVSESTQAHTSVMPGIKYAYQWWRENQVVLFESVEPYFAAGFGGQLISIYPDQNMLIVVTGETANHDENTSRYIYLRNKFLLPAAIPATLSKVFLWIWFLLTAGSLIFLFREIARGQLRGIGWSTCWLLVGALFGPLGLATYLLSYRNSDTMKSSGWKALGISTFFATGSITAIILLAVSQALFLPEGSLILLVIPVSFLINWLVFVAPLVASTSSVRFLKAARQTMLTALISTCCALAGILPVLVLLDFRWPGIGPTNPLSWITMTACSIAAAMVVYPFSYWMARRKLDFWPVNLQDGSDPQPADIEKRLPTLRDAWGALLSGFVVLIVIFGFLILALS